ncbi:MAG: heme o synthase [Thermoprotei archaeon]
MSIGPAELLKLAKPRVIALLDLAALAGYFAAGFREVLPLLFVLVGGSLASAGAMMINEAYEAPRDAVMERTSWRPTAKGDLGAKTVYVIGSTLIMAGVAVSYLANALTAILVAFGALFYVFVYTVLLKPKHWSNIVIGGLAGSAAAWAGYAASLGSLDAPGFLLGILIFMWTPGHFWSLALRFKEDYEKASYPMLPVVFGERVTARAIAISNAAMIPFALALGIWFGLIYLLVSAVASAVLMYFSIRLYRNPTKEEAWRSFKVSSPYLAILLITIIISRAL